MLHSTRLLLVTVMLATLLLGARTARAQQRHDAPAAPKSTATALLLAGGLTVGGLWAGTAMARTQLQDDGDFERTAVGNAGMGLALAAALWGTSAGHAYAGNTRYALLSGAGKSLLLGATVAGDLWFGREDHHPYLTALGVMGVVAWDVYDIVVLPRAVTEHNARVRLRAMPAVAPIAGGWAASMIWQF